MYCPCTCTDELVGLLLVNLTTASIETYQCRLVVRRMRAGLTSSLLHNECWSRLQPIVCKKRSSWKVRIDLLLDRLDFDFIVVNDGPCCIIGVCAACRQFWVRVVAYIILTTSEPSQEVWGEGTERSICIPGSSICPSHYSVE